MAPLGPRGLCGHRAGVMNRSPRRESPRTRRASGSLPAWGRQPWSPPRTTGAQCARTRGALPLSPSSEVGLTRGFPFLRLRKLPPLPSAAPAVSCLVFCHRHHPGCLLSAHIFPFRLQDTACSCPASEPSDRTLHSAPRAPRPPRAFCAPPTAFPAAVLLPPPATCSYPPATPLPRRPAAPRSSHRQVTLPRGPLPGPLLAPSTSPSKRTPESDQPNHNPDVARAPHVTEGTATTKGTRPHASHPSPPPSSHLGSRYFYTRLGLRGCAASAVGTTASATHGLRAARGALLLLGKGHGTGDMFASPPNQAPLRLKASNTRTHAAHFKCSYCPSGLAVRRVEAEP